MIFNTIQYNTIQYNTRQYNTNVVNLYQMRNLSNNTIIQVIQQIRHEIIYEWNHWKIHFFYFFLPCSGRKDSSTHSHYTLLCILSFFLHTTLCSVAQCILIILISYLDLNDNYWSLFWSLYHHHKSFFLSIYDNNNYHANYIILSLLFLFLS